MTKNYTITCIYIALVAIGVVFFAFERFNGINFILYLGTVSILTLAFYVSDRLHSLDLRNLKVVLAEIKEVRGDVYAKAEEVKSMMIDLADSYISSAVETGRFSEDGSLQKKMLSKRARARSLLQKAGIANEDIDKRTQKILDIISWDLMRIIEERAHEEIQKREHPNGVAPIRLLGEIDPDFSARVAEKEESDALEGITQYLLEKELDPADFKKELDELRAFWERLEIPNDGD